MIEQPSNANLNQSGPIGRSNKVQNIQEVPVPVHSKHLPPISERNNGAETSTPARPDAQLGREPALGNPEPEADAGDRKIVEQGIKLNKKIMLIGILVLVAVVALVALIVVLLTNRSGSTIILEKTLTSTKLPSGASIEGQKLKATDPEIFKSSNSLDIYAVTVGKRGWKRPKPIPNPFKKPTIPGDQGGQRRMQEETSEQTQQAEFSSYSFRDQNTGISMSVSSKDLQLRATIDLPAILEFVLNNQPLPEDIPSSDESIRNLQEQANVTDSSTTERISYKVFTFYQVNQQITDSVKKELLKQDSNLKVTQEVALDVQFNQDINAFQFSALQSSSPEEKQETVAFVDPKDTPVIADTDNETEVAKAVTVVVKGVLEKAKEFLTKRMDDLQRVSEVDLAQKDPTNGTTSIYMDQPEDIGKLCSNVDDQTMRCDQKALSSSAIDLAPPEDGETIDGRPTIVVYIDM